MQTPCDAGVGTLTERRFAGHTAGLLGVGGALAILAAQLLPGEGRHPIAVGVAAAVVCVAGLLWAYAVPRGHGNRPLLVGAAAAGVVAMGVAIALTGAGHSPLRVLVVLIGMAFAVICRPRDALGLTALVLVVLLSPMVYDRANLDAAALGELVALAIVCLVLAVICARGRRVLVAARIEAQELALRDPLTELANRRAMMAWLDNHGRGRDAPPIGIILLDLDGFKAINTIHGYRAGDAVLRQVAKDFAGVLRKDAMLARLGGDEFAALLPTADQPLLAQVGGRLIEAAEGVEVRAGLSETTPELARITASAGRVLFSPEIDTVDGVLDLADRCLRCAKAAGKGRVVEPADLATVRPPEGAPPPLRWVSAPSSAAPAVP